MWWGEFGDGGVMGDMVGCWCVGGHGDRCDGVIVGVGGEMGEMVG